MNSKKLLVVFISAISEGLQLFQPHLESENFQRHPKQFSAVVIEIF
jgi:hypothetical protein